MNIQSLNKEFTVQHPEQGIYSFIHLLFIAGVCSLFINIIYRAVVVSSEETIKDVLVHKQDHFSDRPPSFRNNILTEGRRNLFINDSARFRFKKNHMMRAMKLHGDGLKHLEDITLSLGYGMLRKMEA